LRELFGARLSIDDVVVITTTVLRVDTERLFATLGIRTTDLTRNERSCAIEERLLRADLDLIESTAKNEEDLLGRIVRSRITQSETTKHTANKSVVLIRNGLLTQTEAATGDLVVNIVIGRGDVLWVLVQKEWVRGHVQILSVRRSRRRQGV